MQPARRSSLWVLVVLVAIGAVISWRMWERRDTTSAGPDLRDPERVVLFGPNLNEMAAVLGHAGRLVAITDHCTWPPEILGLPRVGGQLDPDLEALALLRPDLLVLQGESALLRSFADAQGLAVANLKMDDSIESILRGAESLDGLLGGNGERGRVVADSLRAQLASIGAATRRAARAGAVPSVLLVLSRDRDGLGNLLTAGEGTFLDELIDLAGGRSWARPRGRGYYMVALEALVEDPPDLVIELATTPAPSDSSRWRSAWARSCVPAPVVRRLEFGGVMVPGPRIPETARALQRIVTTAGAR